MKHRNSFLGASAVGAMALLIGCGGSTSESNNFSSGGFTSSTSGGQSGFNQNGTGVVANAFIPGNALVFTMPGSTADKSDIRIMGVDGSEEKTFATINSGIQGFAINPANRTQKFFGAQRASTGKYGLWRNTALDPTSATNVVTPAFDAIYTVSVTKDGKKVLFTAAEDNSAPKLYVADATKMNGKATALDEAVSFALSPDGKDVIYSKTNEKSLDLFKRKLSEEKPTKIVANAGDDDAPQYSKDGTRIVYTSNKPNGLRDIYSCKANGTDELMITNTVADDELSPTYNADGSAIAYIVPDGAAAGVYRIPSAGGTRISVKVAENITDVYWTEGTGRNKTMQPYTLNRPAKLKAVKKEKAKDEGLTVG